MQIYKKLHSHLHRHHIKYVGGLTIGGLGLIAFKLIISTVGFIGIFDSINGVFAANIGELNSGNITAYCDVSATTCDLSNQGITSIATDTFINYSNLQELYLNGNQITSIEEGNFNGLSNLQTIYLGYNQIISIESGDFIGLSGLQGLYLGANQITSIESGDFFGALNTAYLDLGINQIISIESGDFAGLSNLQALYLSYNQITSIESGTFAGLNNLQSLYLNDNQISYIESGTFAGLNNLQSLYLNDNQISYIETGSFNGFTNIADYNLKLNNNALCINSLPEYIRNFINNNRYGTGRQSSQDKTKCSTGSLGCTDLYANNYDETAIEDDGSCTYQTGILTKNNITKSPYNCSTWSTNCSLRSKNITNITIDTFINHTKLNTLDLDYNQLTSIESGDFAGLSNLQYLNLDYNQISSMDFGSFYGLNNLQSFSLSHNHIKSVSDLEFSGLDKLNYLGLSFNSITGLLNNNFLGLNSLKTLCLSNNKIARIESGSFYGAPILDQLELFNNEIDKIENNYFIGIPLIRVVYLDTNKITSVESGDFYGLNNIEILGLSYNKISTIESGSFDYLTGIARYYLKFNNNNLCTNTLPQSIIDFINYNQNSTQWQSTQDISFCPGYGCTNPKAINYDETAINDNGSCIIYGCTNPEATNYDEEAIEDDGSCIYPEVELNSGNITQDPFNCPIESTNCDLSNIGITHIAIDTFINHPNLVEVYLSQNRITSIESGDFAGLNNLEYLDLSTNKIISIENGTFNGLSSLQGLSLNTNKISSIKSSYFDGLINLQYLELHGNQITSVETGSFDGLSSLQELYLSQNQITSIETGSFDGLSGLQYINLDNNCLNIENDSLVDFLNNLGNITVDYIYQYACVKAKYTPSSTTNGPVTGSLYLTGPTSYVTALEGDNDMITYDYVYTGNMIHIYNYGDMIDNNGYLWSRVMGYSDRIIGRVTRINDTPTDTTPPTINGITNGGKYTTNATFTATDNIGVSSVTLDGTNLQSWTNITTTTIGTHTLIAIDAANNTTTITFEIKAASSGGGGGGGGGGTTKQKDKCPEGDYTNSSYDGKCGEKSKTTTGIINTGIVHSSAGSSTGGLFSKVIDAIKTTITNVIENIKIPEKQEIKENITNYKNEQTKEELADGYQFALEKGITTITKVEEVELDGILTREQMAKMVSNYMINVMGMTGTKYGEKECSKFIDLGNMSREMKSYAIVSCQLGLMGQDSKGGFLSKFNPKAEVTRGQFGTILSRMLRGNKYNRDGGDWYKSHLNMLKDAEIMTNITDPEVKELRGRVMVMMKRANEKYERK